MPEKQKIFITGAKSEIISKVISLIDFEKYEILALTRKLSGIENPQINWIEGNLNQLDQIKDFPNFDILIHAAAITHTFKESDYLKINYEYTKDLITFSKSKACKYFVYISSRTASLESEGYGKSKLLAEKFIIENTSNWIIIRPSEIFGGTKNEAINELIYNSIHKKMVYCPVNLKYKLFPLHIDDCSKIIFDLIFNKKTNNQTITINGNDGFSFKEIVLVTSLLKKNKPIIIPIPKLFLMILYFIIKYLNINIGIVPDQIPRLYSPKTTQKLDYSLISLKDYVKTLK